MKYACVFAAWFAASLAATAGTLGEGCRIVREKDSLIVENTRIRRVYLWNSGDLITRAIESKLDGYVWHAVESTPDLALPGQEGAAVNISFDVDTVRETASHFSHLAATIVYAKGDLRVKRVLRLFPDCPAIASDFYFKGVPARDWYDPAVASDSIADIRLVRLGKLRGMVSVMDKVSMPGKHWRYRSVELFEMTDHLNTLVREDNQTGFFERLHRGNLLFAQNMETRQGLFFLKEAPSPSAQLKYPGGDYLTAFGQVRMIGIGLGREDVRPDSWTQGYSSVVGVFSRDEYSALSALKDYQGKLRKRDAVRDEMIMMNTWGDRSEPSSTLTEEYVLEELDRCARLGITHYQIDYGWQTDRRNLALYDSKATNYRDNEYYWLPDKIRFPRGFAPIVAKAKETGISLGLWFEPNYTDDYCHWSQDADWLIRLNRMYGIRTFKIDGLRIHNKKSEERVDSLLRKLASALDDEVCINLDVTADRRFGYLYKCGYGNIFLENRYTDWGNYYPFQSLRNLWMLSKYVPAQNLQLEFLNKWRCADKYADGDPFAPGKYDFEYLFATTMMAQPLAWMQAHNLPEEGCEIAPVIKNYRKYEADIHGGMIFPIGEEPSGSSWTGFQSVRQGRGYFLVFREDNDRESASMKTWLAPGTRLRLKALAGKGKDFIAAVDGDGEISFSLEEKNSYSLYCYEVSEDPAGEVGEGWERQRKAVRKHMEAVMGKLPRRPRRHSFRLSCTDSLIRPGYVRYSVNFTVAPSEKVYAYLYKPLDGCRNHPAVVALHSTGAGGKKIIDGETAIADRQYARELAERGYVVIAPDYPGFGEDADYDFSSDRYASGTMKGIFNHICCVDLLCTLPYVDKDRIGTIGHSLGGHNAIFLAAFDPRIKATVSSCGWTLMDFYDAGEAVSAQYGGRLGPWAQDRYMPRIQSVYALDPKRLPFDFDEVIASIAPRPFFSISPVSDANFAVEGVRKASERIAAAYKTCRASDNFSVACPACGHDFPPEVREQAYRFLDRFLADPGLCASPPGACGRPMRR